MKKIKNKKIKKIRETKIHAIDILGQDHLRSNLGITCGLGTICGPIWGSFCGLGIICGRGSFVAPCRSRPNFLGCRQMFTNK